MSYTVNVFIQDTYEDLNLYVLKHDFESPDWEYFPRVWKDVKDLPPERWYGLPETEKFLISDFLSLTPAWQNFWFGLMVHHARGLNIPEDRMKKEWASLTDGRKAFTNKNGSEEKADYINGTNLDKEPIRKEGLSTCGNIVKALGDPEIKSGELWVPVECINYNDAPPQIEAVADLRHLVHAATICRPELIDDTKTELAPNGKFRVNPFPNYDSGNGSRVPYVPVPMIAKGGINWIKLSRLRKLTPGERIPSPYVPER
jgi:hypothetical protein